MARLELHWNASNALSRMVTFTALIPDECPKNCATLYLLHGLSDDHSAWLRRTLLERFVAGLPLIVICPDGSRGHYTDSQTMPFDQYEKFLMQSLIPYVDQILPTIKSGNKRIIAGLSMGGYGALKMAMKYPDQFAAGLSFSGAFNFGNTTKHAEPIKTRELSGVFGKKPSPENDLFALAKKVNMKSKTQLRFDCGTEDFCLEWNRKLHKHLENLDIPHSYEEHPGAHNWNYWNKGLLRTLPWILKTLNIKTTFNPKAFE